MVEQDSEVLDTCCPEYINAVFPSSSSPEAAVAWPNIDKIKQLNEICERQRLCGVSYYLGMVSHAISFQRAYSSMREEVST